MAGDLTNQYIYIYIKMNQEPKLLKMLKYSKFLLARSLTTLREILQLDSRHVETLHPTTHNGIELTPFEDI